MVLCAIGSFLLTTLGPDEGIEGTVTCGKPIFRSAGAVDPVTNVFPAEAVTADPGTGVASRRSGRPTRA
jgi:hypothetical protein